ncbi:hypothetical protein DL95DRAFT_389570, partial [Leptodontidium sp. 2 PMI_412]
MTLAFIIKLRLEKSHATEFDVSISLQWFIIIIGTLFPRIVAVLAIAATSSELKRYGGISYFAISLLLEHLFM